MIANINIIKRKRSTILATIFHSSLTWSRFMFLFIFVVMSLKCWSISSNSGLFFLGAITASRSSYRPLISVCIPMILFSFSTSSSSQSSTFWANLEVPGGPYRRPCAIWNRDEVSFWYGVFMHSIFAITPNTSLRVHLGTGDDGSWWCRSRTITEITMENAVITMTIVR